MGTTFFFFFYKRPFQIKYLVVELDEVEVQISMVLDLRRAPTFKGGVIWCLSVPLGKTRFLVDLTLLVEGCIASIGIPLYIYVCVFVDSMILVLTSAHTEGFSVSHKRIFLGQVATFWQKLGILKCFFFFFF